MRFQMMQNLQLLSYILFIGAVLIGLVAIALINSSIRLAIYSKRFLIKTGQAYTYLDIQDIKLIYSEDSLSFAIKHENKKLLIDKSMDKIESDLDPTQYFRINRKFIVLCT